MAPSISENLRGIHANRLCIIAGTGPSTRHLTPETAAKHLVIAVNAAIIKFPKAQYFFTCDPGSVIRKLWQSVLASSCTVLIGKPDSPEGFGHYDCRTGTRYLDGIESRCVHVVRNPDPPALRFDSKDKVLIFGQSSAHCAVHLAYLMGCSPIVLVGCDCGREDGKRYFSDFPGQEQYADEWTLTGENAQYIPPIDDGALAEFVNYWNRIAIDNPQMKLINCGNAVFPDIPKGNLMEVLSKEHGPTST